MGGGGGWWWWLLLLLLFNFLFIFYLYIYQQVNWLFGYPGSQAFLKWVSSFSSIYCSGLQYFMR